MEPKDSVMHEVIDPAILYFGTPVVLLSTMSRAGVANLAPMSSVFWLGRTAIIGMGGSSQTSHNLLETGECVLNLPSAGQAGVVDGLALTTGRAQPSERKRAVGYRYEHDKFARAGVTAVPSERVSPPRVEECPVHLEGHVVSHRALTADRGKERPTRVFEISVDLVHVHRDIRQAGTRNRIDPDRWKPLIMSFQKYYGLTEQVAGSRLATIDEEWYR